MQRYFFLLLMTLLAFAPAKGQVNRYQGDESSLYAETKQLNQFFRRFNNEEDPSGIKYRPSDSKFRAPDGRKRYLKILFDLQNRNISEPLKDKFISEVADPQSPQFLEFHGDDWFAEVTAKFLYKGKEENAVLFMKLERENKGHKWVISQVFFPPISKMLGSGTKGGQNFLHPMSHELDFMNLNKVFSNIENLEDYTERGFTPDFLSIFLYECKQGHIAFKTVTNVKFHFFQVKDWYFEVSEFNRSGNNRGWLISGLTRAPEGQKALIKNYIFRRD